MQFNKRILNTFQILYFIPNVNTINQLIIDQTVLCVAIKTPTVDLMFFTIMLILYLIKLCILTLA